MKKTMNRILLMTAALVLALSLCLVAHAEEAPAAEAWLLYFASNHVDDSANFPWWPQHQRIDQPASETGVEYQNAIVTGPGYYTTSLKFNWQLAEGAIQFNLIIKDAETLFPGYYCKITDIRVNGQSIEVGNNLYGAYHDEPGSGMVSIYNTYWDEKWGGTNGPDGHRAWEDEESAHWLIINPDDIVAGSTLEVDFMFAEKAGEKPDVDEPLRVLGEGPNIPGYVVKLVDTSVVPDNAAVAKLHYLAANQWLHTDNSNIATEEIVIKGEGNYTATAYLIDQGGWTHSHNTNGTNKLYLVVDSPSGTTMEGMKVGVSAIRVDDQEIAFSNAGYGQTYYDDVWYNFFEADDYYLVLYDQYQKDSGNTPSSMGLSTWDGKEGTVAAIDPDVLTNFVKVEVDFFVTDTEGQLPEEPVVDYEYTYYPNNTMCAAGFSLRDRGITDKWYHAVPVDLTRNGIYKIPLIASGMHLIGEATVTVEDGYVTVDYELRNYGSRYLTLGEECLAWFDDISDITADFCAAPQSNAAFGEPYATEGMGNVGYLFICNRVTYRQPYTDDGVYLPRYYSTNDTWENYVANLQAMVDALDAPAE